jgi:hypothetical protein
MPFGLEQFCNIRPWLFHLTSRENVARIKRTRVLQCSTALAALATNVPDIRHKRPRHTRILIDGDSVLLRDQSPLHSGNIRFLGGWDFDDIVADLNGRVFWWPGSIDGPIAYGIRHYERYLPENPLLIRVASIHLFEANGNSAPEFCQYNSGSPRCSGGVGSPRGPGTFVESPVARFTACKVVEVTFREQALLPAEVQTSNSPSGPWRRLM